ncbi:MAG: hypothetical protein IJ849_09350 [Selenomonadaceae bacterium]|nr:hypothetical protein [Selenomonadaceae bacterium]
MLNYLRLARLHPEDMNAYESWRFAELHPYDQEDLVFHYGQQTDANVPDARLIEEVRTLTGYEQDIFKEQDLVSPHFSLQFLYKVAGDLHREDFRDGLATLFAQERELRVHFCPMGGDQRRHKIIFRQMMPKIRYLSLNVLPDEMLDNALQRIMADDRHQSFDWETEPLARFIHVAMKGDATVVLVTISRLLIPVWSEKLFFAYALTCPAPTGGKREDFFPKKTLDEVYDYWSPQLTELPPIPQIPGYRPDGPKSTRKVYRKTMNKTLRKAIKIRAQGNRDLLITMLHTGWGLLQRHMSFGRETCFCLIMPSRTLRLSNAAVAAEAVFPIPMRLMCDYDWLMKDIVGRQMRQMLMSQSMSCPRMRELLEDFGQLPEDMPFRLHFHNFMLNQPTYADLNVGDAGGLLSMASWDEEQLAMTVTFGHEGEDLFVEYGYNPYRLEPFGVEVLSGAYERVMKLLMVCWDMKFAAFDAPLKNELGAWGNPLSKLGW